ncbi:hypothetical protein [Hyphobacterium sp.]|uniref:hypothetical protein n=1 Tax=Hyphobacterium sp. TaxID=2004662 RepID=UPI003B51D6B7
MILQRLSRAIREQNWFAVALEFVIVIAGVVIGFQVTAWNAQRADREALRLAFLRFEAEIDANLDTIAETQSELADAIPDVTRALNTLQQCATGPDAEAAIVAGINQAQVTRGIRFRSGALRELAEQPSLLSQQSEAQRQALQRLVYDLELLETEAAFLELMPFNSPIWRLNELTFADAEPATLTYRGFDFAMPRRRLALSVPAETACRQHELATELYEWEYLQSSLNVVLGLAAENLVATRQALADDDNEASQ